MKLSKPKVEKLIALSEACIGYLFSRESCQCPATSVSCKRSSLSLERVMDGVVDGVSILQGCVQFRELKAFLRSLSDIERREILALISVGYGSWPAKDFQSAFDHAAAGREPNDEICFIATNLFAVDELAEGFEKLNRAGII